MESRRPASRQSSSSGGKATPTDEDDGQVASSSTKPPRLIVDFSEFTVPVPAPTRSLQPDEFRRLFLVSLEKMFTLEPESLPFRQPVDPQALGIPDYNDIIRKPMDLHTIRVKMNCLKYTDPWSFVDDVLLMFDNAWIYNRPASRVFKYCSKLAEVFQHEINPVMQRIGYKYGRIHQFNSQTLSCFGRPVCLISRNAEYYNFLRFHLCEKCYEANMDESGEGIRLPWHNNVLVTKDNFVKRVNDCQNSYSPAAEMHKAYQRDAEMSRQLVIREFLKLLHSSTIHPEKKTNVRKMLRLNGQLRSEFVRYFDQQRFKNLLTPTEVERIKIQLALIDDDEATDVTTCPFNVSKRGSVCSISPSEESVAPDIISSHGQTQQQSSQDDVTRPLSMVSIEDDEEEEDDEEHHDQKSEGGRSLEPPFSLDSTNTSSNSSNCSTISSLKSLN